MRGSSQEQLGRTMIAGELRTRAATKQRDDFNARAKADRDSGLLETLDRVLQFLHGAGG